jgi:hypothetical protein
VFVDSKFYLCYSTEKKRENKIENRKKDKEKKSKKKKKIAGTTVG